MARWRAVPTAVSTAVAALAFLASAGLAVVLGAGLHVWSGPKAAVGLAGQPQPGSVSVTNRVGGVVTVTPPASPPQHPQTRPAGPSPTASLPFIPFAPSAPVTAPPTVTPTEVPTVPPPTVSGPGTSPLAGEAGSRGFPLTLRTLLNALRGGGSAVEVSTGTPGLRETLLAPSLSADTSRPDAHTHANARGHHGDGKGHGRGARDDVRHHHHRHHHGHHGPHHRDIDGTDRD